MAKKGKIKGKSNYTTVILISFLLVILVGAGLLCLPFAAASGTPTDFTTALFTATSATCVTGLVVTDTAAHWSIFGKIVIIALVQIGGLGIMTIISLIAIIFAKNSSLRSRTLAMQAAGAVSYQDVKNILKTIFIGTGSFEFVGACVLSIRFIPRYGFLKGVAFSLFHSISAFCNAGFDIFGTENGSSLTQFSSDPLVLITIAVLIIVGGIGFIVWSDIKKHGLHLKRYSFHSKIALTTTLLLITLGSAALLFTEYDASFGKMDLGVKIMNAFFQSVTLRTAGFSAVDQATLSPSGTVISYFLMFIGGTTGSTAGGIKTTTFAVLVLTLVAIVRRRNEIVVFKRKISDKSIINACSIAFVYIAAVLASIVAVCAAENGATVSDVTFETISAIATVGLSKGITPHLSVLSRYVLIVLMFVGRIGGLSFMLAFSNAKTTKTTERPTETVLIG
ncbi:MAG: Trk family potassium uptake protein [Clostridia bacterium]|nr:Trk family potassium uptake protein [Clostridia bacterium]